MTRTTIRSLFSRHHPVAAGRPGSGNLRSVARVGALVALTLSASPAMPSAFPEPLPAEPLMQMRELPNPLPRDWVYVDVLASERVELIDPNAAAPRHVRGMIGASYVANFLAGTVRPELYVAETFFSRRPRGSRTDVLSIYDSRTMQHIAEVELPAGKRVLQVMQPNAFQLTDEERMALVFNFTPAASVSVVDLVNRRVLSEVPTPGCALIYPSGPRGFAALCSDGTMLAVKLDAAGNVASQTVTSKFNDLDRDPLFSAPAAYGRTNYFVSFLGQVQPVDLEGDTPRVLEAWSLIDAKEAKENWRPSGHQVAATDRDGKLYVIMQKNGREGSHRDGGTEVWVFNPATRTRVTTIRLEDTSHSVAVGGERPTLYVTGSAGTLDRYDIDTGKRISSQPIGSFGAQTVIVPVGR